MKVKPRVLFITFSFPPSRVISSIRSWNISKYLSKLGWDVFVVTLDPSLWQSVNDDTRVNTEISEYGLKMTYSGHRWRCLSSGHIKRSYARGLKWFLEGCIRSVARLLSVDEMVGWYSELEKACMQFSAGDIDVVLVTGGPFGAFGVAKTVSSRLKCPLVLDYRDLWTGGPHSDGVLIAKEIQKERALLEYATSITTVSPSMKQYLDENYGLKDKVFVLSNGYSADEYKDVDPAAFGHFAIVYTGIFIPPKRDVGPIMKALSVIKKREGLPEWRFHYYGPQSEYVAAEATKYSVQDKIVCHGSVSRCEALGAIRGAGLSVVITSVSDNPTLADKGIVTGKIFEPIALGTPVLVVAPEGADVEKLVSVTGGGVVVPAADEVRLVNCICERIAGKAWGRLDPEKYSWPHLIVGLNEVLRKTILCS